MSDPRLAALLAGASLLALLAVAPAQAEPTAGTAPKGGRMSLERADANGDGAVSRAEFLAAGKARFEAMDTGKDGFVDESEREAVKAKFMERAGSAGAKMPAGLAEGGQRMGGARGLDRMDKDGDGKISLAEQEAFDAAVFARLDKNADGSLAGDELVRGPHEAPGKTPAQ
ncbi:MAG: hypothetical protein H6923_10340 [Alphaproteobacteria bacterium]|nr:hypothetical protein [Alphaproteobacteria bacterium]